MGYLEELLKPRNATTYGTGLGHREHEHRSVKPQKEEEDKVVQSIKPTKKNSFPKARKGEYHNIKFDSQLEISVCKALEKENIRYIPQPQLPIKGYFEHQHCRPDFFLIDYKIFVEVRPEALVDENLHFKGALIEKQYDAIVFIINSPKDLDELMNEILKLRRAVNY